MVAATATRQGDVMTEAPTPTVRLLRRTKDDSMIAGVCGGLAHRGRTPHAPGRCRMKPRVVLVDDHAIFRAGVRGER